MIWAIITPAWVSCLIQFNSYTVVFTTLFIRTFYARFSKSIDTVFILNIRNIILLLFYLNIHNIFIILFIYFLFLFNLLLLTGS